MRPSQTQASHNVGENRIIATTIDENRANDGFHRSSHGAARDLASLGLIALDISLKTKLEALSGEAGVGTQGRFNLVDSL